MFDANKTLTTVRGALLEPEPTWEKYLQDNHSQIDTAVLITLPLLAVCLIVAAVTGPVSLAVFSILMAVAGIALWTVVLNFFAAQFGGKSDTNRAFAAVSLAMVPGLVGNVLGVLPWIGWLVAIGLGIYSLVLLYRIVPLAFSLPEESRVKHYVASFLSVVVAMMILSSILGSTFIGSSMGSSALVQLENSNDDAPFSGMFSGIQQNADYANQAQADRYSSPDDGKLSDTQVENFISVQVKTKALRDEQMEKMQALSDQAKEADSQSEDVNVGAFFKAMSGATSIGVSEMKVVKTGGLNWAEHQWVRQQLDIARIQKDINEAVEHNYALYLNYEDELRDYF